LKKVKQRIAILSPVAVVCLLLCALEVAVVDEAELEEELLPECVELVDVVAFLLAVVVVVAPVLEAVVDLVVVAAPVVAAPVVAAPVVVVVTVAAEQWAELTFTVAL